MKKHIVIGVVLSAMAWILTACGGNAGTNTSDDVIDSQAEEQIDTSAENQADIEEESRGYTQEEKGTEPWQGSESTVGDNVSENEETGGQTEMKMNVQIGDYTFTATLENNAAVGELADMMKEGPVTIDMDDYSGFEKVGPLGQGLTTDNSQTTTHAGDIVLYNGNNIVMFYGSNSWSYTRIGRVDDLTDWDKALGSGSITAVFTLAE